MDPYLDRRATEVDELRNTRQASGHVLAIYVRVLRRWRTETVNTTTSVPRTVRLRALNLCVETSSAAVEGPTISPLPPSRAPPCRRYHLAQAALATADP